VWAFARCCASAPPPPPASEGQFDDQANCSGSVHLEETKRLLQSLSLVELRHLWEAIQSAGRREGECVLVERQMLPRITIRTNPTTTATSTPTQKRQQQQQERRRPRHRSVFCEGQRRQQTTTTTSTSEHEPMVISS